MFAKIIGAGLGAKAAQKTSGLGGPMGAVLGATAPVLLKRLSIPAMLAIAAGGYAYKKFIDKKSLETDQGSDKVKLAGGEAARKKPKPIVASATPGIA